MTVPDAYRWFFRKAPTMATLIDGEGRFLDVNDAFLERLGFAREEMIGCRPAEFVTETSARRIENEFLPTLRQTGRLESKPVALRTKRGEVVECLTSSVVEYDPDGSLVRTVAIFTEVAAENIVLTEKQMKSLQKKNLLTALRQTNWKVSGKGGAAELLGVRPTTLADRIKSFGLRKPDRG